MSHAKTPIVSSAAPAAAEGLLAEARGLIIPSRFSGPPNSGNGGYVSGRIAAYLGGAVTVTLRRPVPLETALAVERGDGESVRVLHDGTLIAEATSSPGLAVLKVPDPVSLAEARTAAGGARYFQDSFFPDCFVCGISRRLGDGLRIFPGYVPGRALWAAPWTPNPSVAGPDGKVRPEVVWAALDCPGGIAVAEEANLNQDTAVVLGRMTASLAALPAVGDPCVLIAWAGGGDGRKLTAGSALLGLSGEVFAVAWAVWLTVPRPVPALCGEGPGGEGQCGGGTP
jgi:hypothetical protein